MALAKKCDRCCKLYEVENRTIRKQRVNGIALIERWLNNSKLDARGYLDLCPQCLESFDRWLTACNTPAVQ